MKQEEHLKLIRAWCVNALENIAAKRTPGEWYSHPETLNNGRLFNTINAEESFVVNVCSTEFVHEDAAFIAVCAGAAEAGWKATIAAIDIYIAVFRLYLEPNSYAYDLEICENDGRGCAACDEMRELINKLIEAWPLSLLKHQSP